MHVAKWSREKLIVVAGFQQLVISAMFVGVKFLTRTFSPGAIMFFRQLFGAVVLMFFAHFSQFRPVRGGDIPAFLVFGVVGCFGSAFFQMYGTSLLPTALTSLIQSMAPVVVLVLAAPMLKEKIRWNDILCVGLSLVGIYIVLGAYAGGVRMLGVIYHAISVVCAGILTVLSRRLTQRYGTMQVTLIGMVMAAVCAAPFAVSSLAAMDIKSVGAWEWVVAVLLGFVGTGVLHLARNACLARMEAGKFSLISLMTPVLSTLVGVLFLGEQATWGFVAGFVLIGVGMFISFAPIFGRGRRWQCGEVSQKE